MWVKKHLLRDKFGKHERMKRNKDKQSTAVGSTDLVPGGHADLCFQPGRRPEIWQHEPSCVLLYRRIHIRSTTIFPAAPVRRVSRMCACQNWRDWTTWVTETTNQGVEGGMRGKDKAGEGRGGEGDSDTNKFWRSLQESSNLELFLTSVTVANTKKTKTVETIIRRASNCLCCFACWHWDARYHSLRCGSWVE